MSFSICCLAGTYATGAEKPINTSFTPRNLFYDSITWMRKAEQALSLRQLISSSLEPTGIYTVLTSMDTLWVDKLESAWERCVPTRSFMSPMPAGHRIRFGLAGQNIYPNISVHHSSGLTVPLLDVFPRRRLFIEVCEA